MQGSFNLSIFMKYAYLSKVVLMVFAYGLYDIN